jgi:aminopeptidase N
MEKASGKDLGLFFNQWLYHAENPVLKGNWKYDAAKKQISIHLEQQQNGALIFDMPVELGIYKKGNNTPQIIQLRINTKMTVQTIRLDEYPEKITIDPNTVLLATTAIEEEKR